jgi:TIR domain
MQRRSAKSRARPERAYEYEVFVSYRRRDPVLSWLNNHFFPKLSHWLPQFWPAEMPSPRVAKDDQMETGVRWPERLTEMHSGSRCMVAIVSPEYFRSAWCVSEWRAMQARERHLKLMTKSRARGLIYPVLFCGDASVLPKDACSRQWFDFTKLNFPDEVFRYHPTYVDFDQAVQDVARELVGMIRSAPPRQDWPEIEAPPSLARPPVMLPRL